MVYRNTETWYTETQRHTYYQKTYDTCDEVAADKVFLEKKKKMHRF